MSRKILCHAIFLLISFLLISSISDARPMTDADKGYQYLQDHSESVFNPDGSWSLRTHDKIKILSEQGIQAYNTYKIDYDSNTDSVTEVRVSVTNDGKELVIDPKNIEDKTTFSGSSYGYDETRSKIVPMPNIRVGSIISIEYTLNVKRGAFPGTISHRLSLSEWIDVPDYRLQVTLPSSAKYVLKDDRWGTFAPLLKVSKTADGKTLLVIQSLKTIPTVDWTEEDSSSMPREDWAYLFITSFSDQQAAATRAAEGFEKVLAQPVPARLITLFGPQPTTPLTDDEAQKRLNEIFAALIKNFRYFGDWRAIDGGFVPRALSEIDRTGYGDCKDFATLVTLAARHLGLKANAAFVNRGYDQPLEISVPMLAIYNHTITHIVLPSGKEEWLDATNRVPHVGLVRSDVAGRQALILDPKNKSPLVPIPHEAAAENIFQSETNVDLSRSPDLGYAEKLRISGVTGWEIQNDLLGKSTADTEEYFRSFLGVEPADAQDYKLASLKQNPGFPYEVAVDQSVTKKNGLQRAGELKVFYPMVNSSVHSRIIGVKTDDRVSALDLGAPRTIVTKQKFLAGTYSEILGAPASCQISTPWVDLSRVVTTASEFSIEDKFVVKAQRITRADLQTDQFKNLQKQLRDCLRGVVVVVK